MESQHNTERTSKRKEQTVKDRPSDYYYELYRKKEEEAYKMWLECNKAEIVALESKIYLKIAERDMTMASYELNQDTSDYATLYNNYCEVEARYKDVADMHEQDCYELETLQNNVDRLYESVSNYYCAYERIRKQEV